MRDQSAQYAARQIFHILTCWLRNTPQDFDPGVLAGPNEEAWVKFATGEKLAPTLAAAIASLDIRTHLPKDLSDLFDLMLENNGQRNQMLRREMSSFTECLNQAGVVPIFLKGSAALLDQVYDDPAERFLTDIDCLIGEEELETAFQTLVNAGYEPCEDEDDGPESAHLPPLLSPSGKVYFELHRHLSYLGHRDDCLLDAKQIIAHSTVRSVDGSRFGTPAAEDFVAHLLAHATLSPNQVMRRSAYFRDLIDFDRYLSKGWLTDGARVIDRFDKISLAKSCVQSAVALGSLVFETDISIFGPLPQKAHNRAKMMLNRASFTTSAVYASAGGVCDYLRFIWSLNPQDRTPYVVEFRRVLGEEKDRMFGASQSKATL